MIDPTEVEPAPIDRIAAVPRVPAIYALCGGRGGGAHVAYVGTAANLRRRIEQHLEHRNSSVSTGVAVASLNPALVTEVRWWSDPPFAERAALHAAEVLAFDILDPALRSRGPVSTEARSRASQPEYRERVGALLSSPPSGRLMLPTLEDALGRIAALERQVSDLMARQALLDERRAVPEPDTEPPLRLTSGEGAVGE